MQDAVIFDWDMTDNGICNLGILVRKPAWQTERKSGSALISNKTWCWVLAQHPVTQAVIGVCAVDLCNKSAELVVEQRIVGKALGVACLRLHVN